MTNGKFSMANSQFGLRFLIAALPPSSSAQEFQEK
jgi:hypothetical protein